MFHRIHKTYFPLLLMIIFFFCVVFSCPDNFAQGIYKIKDKIGGSGSSGQTGDTGNNSSTLIIVGAAVIAGFLVYKLVLDKDKPIKDTIKDNASSGESLLSEHFIKGLNYKESEFEKIQNQPINLYTSIQTFDVLATGRKYIVGIIYNF